MESSLSVLNKEKNRRHVVEVPERENTSGRELITNQESRKMQIAKQVGRKLRISSKWKNAVRYVVSS